MRYNELIRTDREFSGDKFRQILESHGITVLNTSNNGRLITVAGHDDVPEIFVKVAQGRNFDKYVFNELSQNYIDMYRKDGKEIPCLSLDRRLQYLSNILMRSGYVGEKITVDMLNSNSPLRLKLGDRGVKELQMIKDEMAARIAVKEERKPLGDVETKQTERKNDNPIRIQRTAEDKYRMTAVIDGKAFNCEMSALQHDKLTAMDSAHTLVLLDRMMPDAGIANMARHEKGILVEQLENSLASEFTPSIFVSKTESMIVSTARNLASANYSSPDCQTDESRNVSVRI